MITVLVFVQIIRQTGSLFDGDAGDLKEKNNVSRKITKLSCGYWNLVQLTFFKVFFFFFHLKAELVSVYTIHILPQYLMTSSEMFNL